MCTLLKKCFKLNQENANVEFITINQIKTSQILHSQLHSPFNNPSRISKFPRNLTETRNQLHITISKKYLDDSKVDLCIPPQ